MSQFEPLSLPPRGLLYRSDTCARHPESDQNPIGKPVHSALTPLLSIWVPPDPIVAVQQ